jgi:phenylacetic acid degradation protein PaaD
VLVVNKADLEGADRTEQELRAMLALRRTDAARPAVIRTVATTGAGVAELFDAIAAHASAQNVASVRDDAHDTATARATASHGVAAARASSDDRIPRDAFARERSLAGQDRYMRHLGAELVDGGEGRASVAMQVRREHLNFLGGCHGGALFSLADMALGLACNSHGPVAALIDAHISFPASVAEGDRLVATAIELTRTRRLGRYTIEVTRDGQMVASMGATVYITTR